MKTLRLSLGIFLFLQLPVFAEPSSIPAPSTNVKSKTVSIQMGSHHFAWRFDREVVSGYFIDGQPWVVLPKGPPLHLLEATPGRLNDQTVYNFPSSEENPNPVQGDIHITVLNPPVNNQYSPQGYLIDKRDPEGVWGWDGRPADNNRVTEPTYNEKLGWDGTTPLRLQAGDSITTPKSITSITMADRSTELEALAVLTVLDAVPPADAFRPGIFREGERRRHPELIRYSDLIDLNGKLISSPLGTNGLNGKPVTRIPQTLSAAHLETLLPGPGFINTGLGYTEGCSAFYNNGITKGLNSYGGHMGVRFGQLAVGSLAEWLTEDERKLCRIRLIQRAIDTYAAVNEGLCLEEGAGILPGYSTLITVAGVLIDHQGMKDVNQGVNGVPPWFIFSDYATTFHTDGVPAEDLVAGEDPEIRLIQLHTNPTSKSPRPNLNKKNTRPVLSTTDDSMTMKPDFHWDYSRPMVNVINLKFKVTAGTGSGETIYIITHASDFRKADSTLMTGNNPFGYEYGGTLTVKPTWAEGNGTPPDSESTLAFSITTTHPEDKNSDDHGRWIWAVNGIVDTASNPHIEKQRSICDSPTHEYASIMAAGHFGQLITLYTLNGQDIYKGGIDKWLIDVGTRPGYGEVLFDGNYLYIHRINSFLGALWKSQVLEHPEVNQPFIYTGKETDALRVPQKNAKLWYETP